VTDVRRILLLLALLAMYSASDVRSMMGGLFRSERFDPFLPAGRALEQRIGDGRFAEALPLAIELDRTYPRQPQIAFWLARVHHGLNDAAREAAAWERYVATSPAPAEACPALPEAYEHAAQPDASLRAYERCAEWAPDDEELRSDVEEARRQHAARDTSQ
jgi:tetratricopeptide (TPR) repeat protein